MKSAHPQAMSKESEKFVRTDYTLPLIESKSAINVH